MASKEIPPYEEVEHTADLALRVRGADLREIFTNAAKGMFALISDEKPALAERHTVSLESLDMEALLVDWLNELLYLAETQGQILGDFRLSELTPTRLEAEVWGARAGNIKKVIKAATFSGLAIQEIGQGGYEVTIVFDV